MNDFMAAMHPDDARDATPAKVELMEKGRQRVATLLGPAPPGGHAAKKGSIGPCRVCGKTAPLTFEHLPPRSSGNAERRRGIDLETDLASPLGEMPSSGWVSLQRGVGLYATCRDCNSFNGSEYVPAYTDARDSVLLGFDRLANAVPEETTWPKTLSGTLQRIHPGALIRQALFMIMAASGSAGLTNTYPELRRIVLGKELLALPGDLTLRLSFVMTRRIRLFPVVAEASFKAGTERVLIEVAHLPFAWLAEIGTPNPDRHSPVVSDWTLYNPGDEHELSLTVPLGAITTALPADYRLPGEVTDGSPIQPDEERPGP